MKAYPSIPKSMGTEGVLHTFDKIDGSNLRFEWTKKKGWFKFGTRRRLFDETDTIFGEAILVFFNNLAKPLERIITLQGWKKVVVFAEFWGENSFIGTHKESDQKHLTVIDVAPHKEGILGPKEFVELFGGFGPKYLGQHRWNKEFIERVKSNNLSGVTFEGVVGKAYRKKKMVMSKVKTRQWIDKVRSLYDDQHAEKIIGS